MDSRRFDSLSRVLAGSGTRRGALKALVVGAFGGAALAVDEAAARPALCRPAGRYCTNNKQCCNKRCRIGKRVPMASRNICDCDAPYGMCGKMCRDFSSDPNNCGGCGIQIDPETELCCDGAPTPIDEDNCHACGEVCGPDDVCCEDGCKPTCEVAAACTGGAALGEACQGPIDCCSLACQGGVCVAASVNCSTYTGSDVVPGDLGACYRLLGEANGSTVLNSQLYCVDGDVTPVSYVPFDPCTSNAECQAFADNDGISGLRGFCMEELTFCNSPDECKQFLSPGQTTCGFIFNAGATCPPPE